MKNQKIIRAIILFFMFVFASLITNFIWRNESIESMRFIPFYVMVFAVCYIVLQIIKRFFFKNQNWWDWLYYIGLIAIVIPRFFITNSNYESMNIFSDSAIVFLIVPIILDVYQVITEKKEG